MASSSKTYNADNSSSINDDDLSLSKGSTNSVNLVAIYNQHKSSVDSIVKGDSASKTLELFFTKGRTTKANFVRVAQAKGRDILIYKGIPIHVLNSQNTTPEQVTFARFNALLFYGLKVNGLLKQFSGITRSLGSGLSIDTDDEELKSVFESCLIPGSGFLPMAFTTKRSMGKFSLLCAAACVGLDFKYLFTRQSDGPDSAIGLLEDIKVYSDDVSCIKQLVRQGFFEQLSHSEVAEKNLFLTFVRSISLSNDSNIGQRVVKDIEKILNLY